MSSEIGLKIFHRVFLFLEIIFGVIIIVMWTLLYPLMRLRYKQTQKQKHSPSVILFRVFVWSANFSNKFILKNK
jgi:heme/copper-type cytochrome/quinol oxidase subunit 2